MKMEASVKIKSLLDELAAVLAEMGAMQEEEAPAARAYGEETPEGEEDRTRRREMPMGDDDDDDDDDEERARRREMPVTDGEETEEKGWSPKDVENTEAGEDEEKKEKKLRCLCSRAEKLREKIKFYEGIQKKELELRSVLDKATPAEVAGYPTRGSKESRSVRIYHNLPGAGRLKNFRGPNAEERAYRAGQYFRATLLGDKNAARWCADHGVESRAQSEGVNSKGGIFLQEEVLNEVIVLVEEFGAYPANARNIQMKSDTLVVPRRTGGLAAYFVGENTTIPDSDAQWDRVQIVAKKAAVSNRISTEVMEDSVLNLADYLVGEISRSLSELVDTVGFVGTGSGDHGGMVGACTKIVDGTHEASVVTALVGNTSALTLDVDDLIATAGRLPLFARAQSKWYCSPAVFAASVQRLGLVNNVGLSGGNTAANLAAPTELRLLGSPVVFVHTMSNKIDADPGVVKFLYGDLSMSSMYATRRGMTVKKSDERYIEQDQSLIVCTTRFDCVTHDCGDNVKAGPIVALKTAAS
jgi:HK97 family phage major capsid protein